MNTHVLTATAFTLSTGLAFGAAAMAADLPKTGSFNIHSAFKLSDQVGQIGDKHIMGSSSAWAITYNDAGSGPLHMGSALCVDSYDDLNGFAIGGRCAWGDSDGDKIFTEFTGKGVEGGGVEGLNTITGGTGKFAGIKGKAPFQCKNLNQAQGQVACTQQFEYQLAGTASNR